MKPFLALIFLLATAANWAQPAASTNQSTNLTGVAATNAPDKDAQAERIRQECIQNRRVVCGRVLQIVPGGVVVDSGYSQLLNPPYNHSWLSPGNISVTRDVNVVEAAAPDSMCIGLVFLTDIPRRPAVKRYDYVALHGYPAGQYEYTPVTNIHKTLRRFSSGLEHAVTLNLQATEPKKP